MTEELIYVYCASNREPKFEDKYLGSKIYFIHYEGIYAIVSNVSTHEFSEENLKKNLSDINWVELKTREHVRVLSQVMETSTVIPFKFGVIFETEDNLKKMIEDCSPQLKGNMVKLNGKEEWSVKIYCNFNVLNDETVQHSDKIKQLDQEILSSPPGKAFLLMKKRKELVKDEAHKKISQYGRYCFETLKDCAQEAVVNKLLSKEVTEKENDMILNSVYLIARDKCENFLNEVEKLKNERTYGSFQFDCTGPWPPYNFITINSDE